MLKVGKHTYFADGQPIIKENLSNVIIGSYCSIADQVIFDGGFQHNLNNLSLFPFNKFFPEWSHLNSHPITKGDIIIGSDVWIGMRAIIMSGVKIGHGAVIGANSVVTKDVEPYSVVGGSPAKLIKYRFLPFQRQVLLKIRWWDWDENFIRSNIDILMSNDFDSLYKLWGSLLCGQY